MTDTAKIIKKLAGNLALYDEHAEFMLKKASVKKLLVASEILKATQKDKNITPKELSHTLGLDEKDIYPVLVRLRRDGIILGNGTSNDSDRRLRYRMAPLCDKD